MENKIYKEAILDAKALRASAIANAKSMMQEAIEPAIQEMMRLKLSEELEEDTLEEDAYEEGYKEEGYNEEGADYGVEEGKDEEVTEATLEEILAELDALEEDSTLNEAEDEEEGEDVEAEEAEEETEEGAVDDETKVVDITLGDLKAALFPQMGGAEGGDEAGEEAPVSLDEILAELEEKEEGKHSINEGDPGVLIGGLVGLGLGLSTLAPYAIAKVKPYIAKLMGKPTVSDKEIKDLDAEALKGLMASKRSIGENQQLNEGDPSVLIGGLVGLGLGLSTLAPYAIAKIKPYVAKLMGKPTVSDEEIKNLDAEALKGLMASKGSIGEADKMHAMEEELAMANETIETLRESINEINLLNAKLLYMNKIFKAKNLTESQKVKVVKAFDRSTSVREVKNTYEVLKESIETKKSQLKESVGFASKPIGSVAKNNIIEADPFINRWQKIAGIKK